MVWPLPQPSEIPVASLFLGFTNETLKELQITNVTLALFAVRNFPGGPTPDLREVGYKKNDRWQSRRISRLPPGMFISYRTDTGDFTRIIMALPVTSTNQPARFVFEFPGRDSISIKEMFQRMMQRLFRRGQSTSSKPMRERSLFFTNEIILQGSR